MIQFMHATCTSTAKFSSIYENFTFTYFKKKNFFQMLMLDIPFVFDSNHSLLALSYNFDWANYEKYLQLK